MSTSKDEKFLSNSSSPSSSSSNSPARDRAVNASPRSTIILDATTALGNSGKFNSDTDTDTDSPTNDKEINSQPNKDNTREDKVDQENPLTLPAVALSIRSPRDSEETNQIVEKQNQIIAAQNNKLAELGEEIKSLKAMLTGVTPLINEFNRRLAKVESDTSAFSSRLAEMETVIPKLVKGLESNQGGLKACQGRIDERGTAFSQQMCSSSSSSSGSRQLPPSTSFCSSTSPSSPLASPHAGKSSSSLHSPSPSPSPSLISRRQPNPPLLRSQQWANEHQLDGNALQKAVNESNRFRNFPNGDTGGFMKHMFVEILEGKWPELSELQKALLYWYLNLNTTFVCGASALSNVPNQNQNDAIIVLGGLADSFHQYVRDRVEGKEEVKLSGELDALLKKFKRLASKFTTNSAPENCDFEKVLEKLKDFNPLDYMPSQSLGRQF